jgi:hypothetical protein
MFDDDQKEISELKLRLSDEKKGLNAKRNMHLYQIEEPNLRKKQKIIEFHY